MGNSLLVAKERLLKKYSKRGSYYTAYPPPGVWVDSLSSDEYKQGLIKLFSTEKDKPLQLYVHFPFCKIQCFYCQCYQITTRDYSKIKEFLGYLYKEIELFSKFFNEYSFKPHFVEVHLGGGSPSYMKREDLDTLVEKLNSIVDFNEVREFAIEIDPRTVNKEDVKYYQKKGITRISYGIQDFDQKVQKAINRVHSIKLIEELTSPEVRELFDGINFDLIYGLPLQTPESFKETIETAKRLSPERIALSILGHRPDIFKHNKFIKESDLPSLADRISIWESSLKSLLDSGYERIGMDHFAKPTDELAKAKYRGTLFRNPMGYSPGRFHDNIGLGPSAINRFADFYFQEVYLPTEYYAAIDNNRFPIFRGHHLCKNDLIRRDIMNQVMTYQFLKFENIEKKYNIRFVQYFKKELNEMDELVQDGILEISADGLTVKPIGDLFLRNICTVFDDLGREYKHSVESALANKGC